MRLLFMGIAISCYGLLCANSMIGFFQFYSANRTALPLAFIRHIILVPGFFPLLFVIFSCLFAKGSHIYVCVLVIFLLLFFLHIAVVAFSAHTDDMYWVVQGGEALTVILVLVILWRNLNKKDV